MPSIQIWTKAKLDLLGKYLHAYPVIMTKQKASWLEKFLFSGRLCRSRAV